MTLISFNLLSNLTFAIIYTCVLIMFTIGLNMIYSVLKFSNFAHAEWVTAGLYFSWWVSQVLYHMLPTDLDFYINNIFIHAALTFILVGSLGIVFEILVFSKLRLSKANATSLTVATIGVGFVIRYLLAIIFGDSPQRGANYDNKPYFPSIIPELFREERYNIELFFRDPIFGTESINFTNYHLYLVIIAIVMVIAIDLMFRYTRFGIALRATSDSMELAQVSGINTKRIVYYTWFLAAGITGFAATLYRPTVGNFNNFTGFYLLLPIFAVVILGGVGSFRGGIIAAIIIGFTRQFATVLISELKKDGLGKFINDNVITLAPQYADGIGFIILIIVLLYRPQGIMGSVDSTRARV